MEVTKENLETLANYLQQTLSPDLNVRKPAEDFLVGVEVNQNFAVLLLNLIDKDNFDITIRMAAAIAFKNYIKRNWPIDEDGTNRMHESDRITVKYLIVPLMLKSPESVQKQFSDAVSIIGKYDFPEKWPNLLPEMVNKFATGDFHVINGVLRTAHSLFKRYRHEFKSQKLWEEIKYVLENFAKPLTDLFVEYIVKFGLRRAIKMWEDKQKEKVKQSQTVAQEDDEVPGVMEQLKTEICECATMYAQKYDEEFAPHAPGFATAIWTLLLSTGLEPKYDLLVSNALIFLSKIADRNAYKSLFEDPATLSNICEKVVIPNMHLRDSDLELFEDNPEEYVRRDIEGSDVDTRRRAACDLVRTLSQHFEEKMVNIFGQYVQLMLSKYAESGHREWRGKDTAMYLVTSLVSRGSTNATGVTKASSLVDLGQFAVEHVVTELQKENVMDLPVLKADAIKYLMTFRSLLPAELTVSALPYLINHLKCKGVVCTYSACCIEKLIAGGVISRTTLEPHAAPLLISLFQVMAPEDDLTEQNEYVMKAVLRTMSCLQEASLQYLGAALPKLALMLSKVAKNPSKPHFNHYLFETLSLAITLVTKANPSTINAFEDMLFPIFQDILKNDIQEFMPYVFQMLSLLLELRASTPGAGGDCEAYAALLPCLVAPALWERPANIRPLVRLLCAFLSAKPDDVITSGKLSDDYAIVKGSLQIGQYLIKGRQYGIVL
ncbi:Exportin-2 [Eumeta japonica]|uniref:Exportin-2 n=1 Tax=Eumeta variegata TaxID=151549 RepID=A0A4C1Y1Y0_EUMVA|nr:Exportin-2 [Eumeta japonica]